MAAESKTQSTVVLFATALEVLARKLSFGEGWPDYMFLYGGEVLFVEFKAPGERPTRLQQFVHGELYKRKHHVKVIDDPEKGIALIKEWIHGIDKGNDLGRRLAGLRPHSHPDE